MQTKSTNAGWKKQKVQDIQVEQLIAQKRKENAKLEASMRRLND